MSKTLFGDYFVCSNKNDFPVSANISDNVEMTATGQYINLKKNKPPELRILFRLKKKNGRIAELIQE